MIHASCHCGAVRLEIARRPRQLTECNCSICRRYGTRWAYYTQTAVRVVGRTVTYAWRPDSLAFHHCPRCGCVTHWARARKRRDARMGVNARLMEPEAIAGVRVRLLDGASTWKYLT